MHLRTVACFFFFFFLFIVAWFPNLNGDASPYFGEYPLMLGIVFRVLSGDKSNFNMFPYK